MNSLSLFLLDSDLRESMVTLSCFLTDATFGRAGSGKTLAFAVPIIATLKAPAAKGFRAVIVSPTRELAVQIKREVDRVAAGTKLQIRLLDKSTASVNSFGVCARHAIHTHTCTHTYGLDSLCVDL